MGGHVVLSKNWRIVLPFAVVLGFLAIPLLLDPVKNLTVSLPADEALPPWSPPTFGRGASFSGYPKVL